MQPQTAQSLKSTFSDIQCKTIVLLFRPKEVHTLRKFKKKCKRRDITPKVLEKLANYDFDSKFRIKTDIKLQKLSDQISKINMMSKLTGRRFLQRKLSKCSGKKVKF